ncbi:MAG: transposase [bacterium]|nr:transposase [bacterium]
MNIMIKSSSIPEKDKTPLVIQLLEIIRQQAEEIQRLKDEIARLKEHPGRPQIRPSRLEQPKDDEKEDDPTPKRPGSSKRRKTEALDIHETIPIAPEEIPVGSIFKGYNNYTVQDLQIQPHNICYRLEKWETPEGTLLVGQLPDSVKEGHFGSTVMGFILYQYYHGHVTQPLLLEQLWEYGIEISAGQLSRILTENKDSFHEEKDELFATGLEVSRYVQVDDTGARHQGKNGYCTHIGNEWFSFFESTESKSRLNFLTLLRAGHSDYVLNPDALTYMEGQGLAQKWLTVLRGQEERMFDDDRAWELFLESEGMTGERVRQIVTEGALLGSVLHHGIAPGLVIISDDAGQFNILLHALCWVHAERVLDKIVAYTEQERQDLEAIQEKLWQLYRDLKGYKDAPDDQKKAELERRFDVLFTTLTHSESLNSALQRIHRNKTELLLVLTRPEIPLHNNLRENAIREYVKRRKISGSTRSEAGRRCRDTFTSLKKSCRKLGVSFWQYLLDRISRKGSIPRLSTLIRQRAVSADG